MTGLVLRNHTVSMVPRCPDWDGTSLPCLPQCSLVVMVCADLGATEIVPYTEPDSIRAPYPTDSMEITLQMWSTEMVIRRTIRLLTSHLIDLQWHPATYFAPPAATFAPSNSIICMGASWLAIVHRGGAGLCNSA